METVFGLLLMLLGICHGVETDCDGRQDGAQCYGVVDGTVILQLMDNALEIPGFDWKHDSQNIIRWISDKIVVNQMENRSLFIPSKGTFIINNLSRTDSGEYTLTTFDSQRKQTGNRTFQLTVEEKDQLPVTAGILSTLLILMAVGVAVILARRKLQNKQEEEGDQELTYADVRMVRRQERKEEIKAEAEIEYGQVTFSERPWRTEPTMDDLFYH